MCKFLICMIDAYKCILRMMSQIRRWTTCWYTDGLIRGGYGRISNPGPNWWVDTDAASERKRVLSLYPCMCASIYLPLIFLYLHVYLSLYFDLYLPIHLEIHIIYYIYLPFCIYSFPPAIYTSTYLQIFLCIYLYVFISVWIYLYMCSFFFYVYKYMLYNTHEHILYKMTGVKVCYILFYAPPAALLPGVTHPTL